MTAQPVSRDAHPKGDVVRYQPLVLSLLVVLVALVVGLGAVSFARRIQDFQPLGFDLDKVGNAWMVTKVDSASELASGDLVLLVNGEQVLSRPEIISQLRRREVSELLVERGGEVVSAAHQLPPLDLDFPYLVLALIGVVYLFIGLFILRRGLVWQAVLFNLWCLASASLYLLMPVIPPQDVIDRLIYVVDEMCRLLLPPLTLHFFLVFPQRLRLPSAARGWLGRILPFLYLPSVAVLLVQLDLIYTDGSLFAGPPTPSLILLLDRLELILLVAFLLASVAALITQVQQAKRWEQGRQVTWITLGMTAGYLPFLAFYVAPFLMGLNAPEALQVAAILPLALVPLSFAYAILRYRLWDISVIVRDVTTYALTLLIGALGFSLLNLVIRRSLPEDMDLTRSLSTVVGGLMIAGLLVPARQGIHSTLERFHYRGSFGRRRALARFGQELLHERDLDRLSTGLLRQLEETMDLGLCNLYLVQGDELVPIRQSDPESVEGDETETSLPLDGVEASFWEQDYIYLHGTGLPGHEGSVQRTFFLRGYRAAFPLKVRDRQIGLVLTGYKEGEIPLNSDDALLIRQLLNQAALAIENALLLEHSQGQLREMIELKRFNEEIIESSPAGIAVLDADDRIVAANVAFAALVGAERSALKRRRLAEVMPLEMRPVPSGALLETEFTDARGRQRQLQLSMAGFVGSEPGGLHVLVVNDVTDFAAMEKALEEKERLAALGIMAAGVAHEVNTPLTGISSYAQMLLSKTPEEDPRHSLLKKVETQTFRAARIVNTLLDLSRESRPDPEPVSLARVARDCRELLAEALAVEGVELDVVVDGATEIDGNEGELHQVFTNILSNAVDAVSGIDQPRIEVRLDGNDGGVRVQVRDNGPGIAPEHLKQIFRPFFSTKGDRGGTGLGLSICYEIVRRHGGELRAENVEGGGCRFSFRLPRRAGGPRGDAR